MLAGRDTVDMVNMIPHMEEYKFMHPVAKHHGEVKSGSTLTVKLPFLTNKADLAAGDLLVVPYDGGLREFCTDTLPPIPKSNAGAMSHTFGI